MTDFEFLEDIIRKNSASFYKSFRKLPKEKAQAVFAVYAFCRLLDDTVDLEMSPEALERHRIRFEEVVSGVPQEGGSGRHLRISTGNTGWKRNLSC